MSNHTFSEEPRVPGEEGPSEEVSTSAKEVRWSREKIVREIQLLASQGIPLSSTFVQKNHTKLHSASQRYFSSWGDAVNHAGFDYDGIKGVRWTKETVIKEIIGMSRQNADLSSSAVQKDNTPLFQAACRIFGSWKEAVASSGIEYSKHRKQREWTEESVICALRVLLRAGEPVSAGIVSKKYGSLYQATRRLFKGIPWDEIISTIRTPMANRAKRDLK